MGTHPKWLALLIRFLRTIGNGLRQILGKHRAAVVIAVLRDAVAIILIVAIMRVATAVIAIITTHGEEQTEIAKWITYAHEGMVLLAIVALVVRALRECIVVGRR